MNLYLTKFKVKQIRKAAKDFGSPIKGFTRKAFFYFFIHDGIKYIHKESLHGVYTNAFTYSDKEDTPNYCELNSAHTDDFYAILDFVVKGNKLLPNIECNDKFIYHKLIDGDILTHITQEQFTELEQYESLAFTPFYNSMCYNLIDTPNGIKLIDFKHFERKGSLPFFVFMNNDDANINVLHMKHSTPYEAIIKHLNKDYNVALKDIIYYE